MRPPRACQSPGVAAAAGTTPARIRGIGHRTGVLRPALAADLVACDEESCLRAVTARGQWLRRQWLDVPG